MRDPPSRIVDRLLARAAAVLVGDDGRAAEEQAQSTIAVLTTDVAHRSTPQSLG
jgi:hypothetical protein